MRIAEIPVGEVLAGNNWRFVPSPAENYEAPMEMWNGVLDRTEPSVNESVLYSCIVVSSLGHVTPMLLLKVVGDAEFGGDYCEFVDGRWRQLGLTPNPNADIGDDFVANPLATDPSFSDEEYRNWHRAGFRAHVGKCSL